jgi:hypothetical protein
MFVPLPPPPKPQRIAPVEEHRICPRFDLACRVDMTNNVLEGFSRLKSEASNLIPTGGGGVTVYPGTGRLHWTGYTPEVIVGAARAA